MCCTGCAGGCLGDEKAEAFSISDSSELMSSTIGPTNKHQQVELVQQADETILKISSEYCQAEQITELSQ